MLVSRETVQALKLRKNLILYLGKMSILRKIKRETKEWCANKRHFPFDRSQRQGAMVEISWNLKF